MNSRYAINRAVWAALGTTAASGLGIAPIYAADATAPTETAAAPEIGLAEIVVTAQRRVENLQNVPIAITALTSESLTQLDVSNFSDYAKFVPNMTSSTSTPGLGQIYMRGLATTEDGTQSSGATGPFPNVAVYLDDQSVQLPGRNLDIYAADLQRIEILEGPQGTLFGAGAQAGVVRYITNKPNLNADEGAVNGSYGLTTGGDPSSAVDAMLNLALVPNVFAIRAVVYSDTRGGYINNAEGSFTRSSSDIGIKDLFGGSVPPGSLIVNNVNLVQDHFNPVTYKGLRVSALYQINDDWSILLQESTQNMQADGLFVQEPFAPDGAPLPARTVVSFTPNYNRDRFTDIAWTLNGKLGDLKAVYTGGYLSRNINQVADYTNYARGVYGAYYQCPWAGYGAAYGTAANSLGACSTPVSTFQVQEHNTHLSNEIRLSTPDDWRIRGILGLYQENYKIGDYSAWLYGTLPNYPTITTPSGIGAYLTGTSAPGTGFIDNVVRGYDQDAIFGSVDADILPKVLTFTAGTRFFHEKTFETGDYAGSFYAAEGYPTAHNGSYFTALNDSKTYQGTRSRLNLTWHVTPDAMVYGTFSQGFRPGGFNRGTGAAHASYLGQWVSPLSFASDDLTNYEVGYKTQWFDHRLQFNGAFYEERWNGVQVDIFDPAVFSNLTFTTNGANYIVKGAEVDITARPIPQLTLALSGAINDSYLSKEAPVYNGSTVVNWAAEGLPNPLGSLNSPLANSPKDSLSARVRYEFTLGNYDAYVQTAGNYRSSYWTTTDRLSNNRGVNEAALIGGWGTQDVSVGVSRNSWHADLYVSNMWDRNAVTFQQVQQFIIQQSIAQPRTVSFRIGYKFNDNGK